MSSRLLVADEPVYVQDPALKRIAAVGATVFGLACAGLVGLVVSSVDRNMHINAAFSAAAVPTTRPMSVVPVAQRAQTSLAAGAHQKEGSNTFFNSGFVPRNVIKPGFKDTGIVAVRLHAKGGMAASEDCCPPNMEKRMLMNYILLGSTGLTVGSIGVPAALFFVPPGSGGGGGGLPALDANGNQVTSGDWLKSHLAGDRSLVQGLKGDATYLIVNDQGAIQDYGLNAVCTHLGCVVPWNKAENKFMCPCHGSQYNAEGKKVRGPAPLSLALAHVNIDEAGAVQFTPWTETDFRTGDAPWWKA
jgi:cytochrome b6-f complex iron-sulfur subunit|uniref:plastoquinol--plastocyanin reductase n=1 Tax=Eutreptiella gymnastica TaxID=73025 RepID=A0A7S4FP92_9EUGL|eukprot:CAMPEP_0174280462 /NCGR_PEP_ID=MMETSP0809-20121228/737_1 /TAXON_ID=73025 ORGANISM="Eutreptiella gymnastica-like, Strain CCMP1594" /NCGR_SAMPLE_ID=MMETSP0809 /ASSEMBLY_ACC=CAM_ASM_000658 /LENGTH=302 /DNA_ID=CAMNT_0015373361 /DNA_START=81 /DNA_END=989 /DNA_ORIENTATION=-